MAKQILKERPRMTDSTAQRKRVWKRVAISYIIVIIYQRFMRHYARQDSNL
jgi:hypothetical protein